MSNCPKYLPQNMIPLELSVDKNRSVCVTGPLFPDIYLVLIN